MECITEKFVAFEPGFVRMSELSKNKGILLRRSRILRVPSHGKRENPAKYKNLDSPSGVCVIVPRGSG